MRLATLLSSFALGAVVACTAGSAAAAPYRSDDDFPLAYVLRPITLPRLTLAPELDLELGRALSNAAGTTAQSRVTLAGMNLGAAFGITNDLEVGAFVLPLQLAPLVSYGSGTDAAANLQVFATYRFVNNSGVEIGGRVRTYFITTAGAGVQIAPSVLMRLHFGKIARLDMEAAFPITARGKSSVPGSVNPGGAVIGLGFPVAVAFNITDPFHLGASSGIRVDDLGEASKTFTVPLGFFAGFAFGGKRPIVDLDAFFQFGDFFRPGGGPLGGDKIVAGSFHTGLSVKGYFYF